MWEMLSVYCFYNFELFGRVPTQCTGGDMECMHMLQELICHGNTKG